MSAEPGRDCPRCPRLVEFRRAQRASHRDWHNAPVPSFGELEARLLIVGLAPGLKGANRTGRPFTGDYAGDLLYATLLKTGFARGNYAARPDDGLVLRDCRVTNVNIRLEGCILGNDVEIVEGTGKPRVHRFMIGDQSRVELV